MIFFADAAGWFTFKYANRKTCFDFSSAATTEIFRIVTISRPLPLPSPENFAIFSYNVCWNIKQLA